MHDAVQAIGGVALGPGLFAAVPPGVCVLAAVVAWGGVVLGVDPSSIAEGVVAVALVASAVCVYVHCVPLGFVVGRSRSRAGARARPPWWLVWVYVALPGGGGLHRTSAISSVILVKIGRAHV